MYIVSVEAARIFSRLVNPAQSMTVFVCSSDCSRVIGPANAGIPAGAPGAPGLAPGVIGAPGPAPGADGLAAGAALAAAGAAGAAAGGIAGIPAGAVVRPPPLMMIAFLIKSFASGDSQRVFTLPAPAL